MRRFIGFQMSVALAGCSVFGFALGASSTAPPCIKDGAETAINAALSGPGSRALLCPGAVIRISHPIVMGFADQELATQGSPRGDARAIIRVVGEGQATAIESRASGIHLHHVIIDGQRRVGGKVVKGGALIEVGGAVSGIRIDHIRSFDPRGWSALHVFEGGGKCTDARITESVLGPSGSADGAWADGISFACRMGLITDNLIVDASDGGIVIFGAPGTLVRNNTVRTETNTLLGGINLVDYAPYSGDYSGVVVRDNVIEARGGFIKVAIAAGPAAWGIGKPADLNHGAKVLNNRIVGTAFGYGIVVDGVADFMFTGNRVLSTLTGGRDTRCDARHVPSGVPFVRDAGDVTSRYQAGFTAGPARWSICVEPR
jgi:hypothetical protein